MLCASCGLQRGDLLSPSTFTPPPSIGVGQSVKTSGTYPVKCLAGPKTSAKSMFSEATSALLLDLFSIFPLQTPTVVASDWCIEVVP